MTTDVNRFSIVRVLYSRVDSPSRTFTTAYMIRNEKTLKTHKLNLRDIWTQSPVLSVGTIINICGTYPDENDEIFVERNQGYLIVEPDRLVSVTNIVGNSWCNRKVAFSERFRFPIDNVDMLRGNIAHELISMSFVKKLFEFEAVQKELGIILRHPNILEKAYGLGMNQKSLSTLVNGLALWCISFTSQRVKNKQYKQKWNILHAVDIEECYWNPEFGLKGKVDCTVVAKNELGELMTIPMEFKTGNPKFSGKSTAKPDHLGQVYLYTLLMGSATNSLNNNGMLYYISEDFLVECDAPMRDLQALIMSRNQIVLNTPINGTNGAFSALPRPSNVDFDHKCHNCEYRNTCSIILEANTTGVSDLTVTEKKLIDSLGHLTHQEKMFFSKWLNFVNLETDENESLYNTKNLWLKTVTQREDEGTCLGNLTLTCQTEDGSKSNVLGTFSIPSAKDYRTINMFEKDYVILGVPENPCVSFAVVEIVKKNSITLSFERLLPERHIKSGALFSIDKIESNNAGMMQYVYLAKLLEDNEDASRIRKLLVEKTPPVFKKLDIKEYSKEERQIMVPYNKYQRTSIFKAITTDSFLLVKGSPGCGKTTTIVGLIRLLVSQKKSVLISTYTSNALDNILLSYKKYSNNFMRIGAGGKLMQDKLSEHSSNNIRMKVTNVDQLTEIYNAFPVVATTLMSLKHPIFNVRKFDYCIVDEGSQALPTALFGVFLQAKKVIVFGDPHQLPAIIRSKKIKTMGIEDNIFSMYEEPIFCTDLSIQYRMNQYIMKLANELLYGNKMQCASTVQAQGCIVFPSEAVKTYLRENIPLEDTRKWLCLAVSRRPERAVMFFDTKDIEAYEQSVAISIHNRKEGNIAIAVVKVLEKGGINLEEIGIISPFRGQVNLMREKLQEVKLEIEVNTIDQYQGREKNIIIVTFAKSRQFIDDEVKAQGVPDGILNDIRRLNVAITRAKAKVILIGNSKTLKVFPACERLLSLLDGYQQFVFRPIDFSSSFFQD